MSTHVKEQMAFVTRLRPRNEGANIGTWIGFKHILYMVEEAILEWARDRFEGPGVTFSRGGAEIDLVDSSATFLRLLHVDDLVEAEVTPRPRGRFSVRLFRGDEADRVLLARARATVGMLRRQGAPERSELLEYVLERPIQGEPPTVVSETVVSPGGFDDWSWTARYFHCHYSRVVAHSAYVRAIEECVDRFLDASGLPIPEVLDTMELIPVVSRAGLSVEAEARIGERILAVLRVEEIMRGLVFRCRIDFLARRDGVDFRVATGHITHGYANASGEGAGALVPLPDAVLERLSQWLV